MGSVARGRVHPTGHGDKIGGSASPAYLKVAVNALEKVLPQARRVEFPGLHQEASGNTNRGDRLNFVARELPQFFA